jgi:mannosyltransferase
VGADTVVVPVSSSADRPVPTWCSPRVVRTAVLVVLAVAVVIRFIAVTPMWLDEAQTVAIARRPFGALLEALRHDGSPPLFYLLLHGWMRLFGTGTIAVRAFSGVCSVASLPLIWLAARRLGASRGSAWAATLLLATSPFAIRYATEARMYAFVALLVLLAVLAYERVWRQGGVWAYVGGAVVTAALITTHYWCLFLVAVVGAGALVTAVRGARAGWRLFGVLAIGCLGFVPWLPTFAYQTAHTGAPWGSPPSPETALWAPREWAGAGLAAAVLAFAYYALLVLALAGRAVAGRGVVLGRPVRRLPAVLIGTAVLTMLLGSVVTGALRSAYAGRYAMVALVPFLLGVAMGFRALPASRRLPALAGVLALGLAVAVTIPDHTRSQAGEVAAALTSARTGDVVVFCPDQLGPAVHRLSSAGRQVVYPTLGSPAMVDWVDYKDRNVSGDPVAFTRQVLRIAGPRSSIWLVYASGYPTFGDDCARIYYGLQQARPITDIPVHLHKSMLEHERVVVFGPRH